LINYREREDWDNAVLEITGKRGVDHIVEVGGPGTLPRSMRAVKVAGHIAVIGVVAGKGEFTNIPIFMKALRMIGVFVGSRVMFEEMNAEIAKSKIHPVIDRTFAFDEVAAALSYLKSGQHFGKIVVRI